jgi:lipocalin
MFMAKDRKEYDAKYRATHKDKIKAINKKYNESKDKERTKKIECQIIKRCTRISCRAQIKFMPGKVTVVCSNCGTRYTVVPGYPCRSAYGVNLKVKTQQ